MVPIGNIPQKVNSLILIKINIFFVSVTVLFHILLSFGLLDVDGVTFCRTCHAHAHHWGTLWQNYWRMPSTMVRRTLLLWWVRIYTIFMRIFGKIVSISSKFHRLYIFNPQTVGHYPPSCQSLASIYRKKGSAIPESSLRNEFSRNSQDLFTVTFWNLLDVKCSFENNTKCDALFRKYDESEDALYFFF